MVGVGQDDARPKAAEVLGVDRLDSAAGAHRHEGWRLDDAMAQGQARGPRRHRPASEQLEFQAGSSSIASPKL